MPLPALLILVAVAGQLVLAAWVLARAPRHPVHRWFSVGMLVLACETFCSLAAGYGHMSIWRFAGFISGALVPAPWLAFSLTYGRAEASQNLRRHARWLLAVAAIPPALAIAAQSALLMPATPAEPGVLPVLSLGWSGLTLRIFGFLAGIFVLTNLERTFRDSVGIMRWRLKYMVLGLGVLFGFRLYRFSQNILYSSLDPSMLPAQASVALLAMLLIVVALRRERIFEVNVYPSHALLFHSVTLVVAGAYLLLVGLLSKLVRWFGGDSALPLQAFIIMLALVGLAMALLSERLRRRIQLFVSRHLRRPAHDYRRVWTTFASKTASHVDESSYARAIVAWLADTFRVLSVNLWILDDERDEFRLGGSSVLTSAAGEHLIFGDDSWKSLARGSPEGLEPVDLDRSEEKWAEVLRDLNPGVFPDGGHRFALPLATHGELRGLIVLGDRVGGAPFTTEDLDLLRCVGDQVASGLLNLNLSRRLLRAKEFEAFQTMSAFFVHDLKNTASTLSLTLQNLGQHFGNPEFREDALRAIGKSVQHLENLIQRLTQLRAELVIRPVPSDLSQLVRQVIEGAGTAPGIRIRLDLVETCPARFDPEQMGKVVLNLVLNARDALGNGGEIHVVTRLDNSGAEVAVTDTGCGMSAEFIRQSLFRPFRTTKKRGIGIGMFQSKLIVDAHGGRIHVESSPGKGTSFHVRIPATSSPPGSQPVPPSQSQPA